MAESSQSLAHRVLLVDDDGAVRTMLKKALTRKGFEVVTASSVPEALRYIADETFDVLVTNLHMPEAGDGFTVVSAMRHSQPKALTLLVSGYLDVEGAVAAILLEADEVLVKPFEIGRLTDLIQVRVLNRKPIKLLAKKRMEAILLRSSNQVVEGWLQRAKQSRLLNHLPLSDAERTGHLPRLVEDLAVRLGKSSASASDSDAVFSDAAVAHGKLRFRQGYTPPMLVHESRILQLTLFGTVQSNLNPLDFSLLLTDVMAIADEVDAQLAQTIGSFMKVANRAVA